MHQPPRIRKPKLLRSNPLRLSLIRGGVDPAGVLVDDEDVYVGYRRRDLTKIVEVENDDNLPDRILTRLEQARELAMSKYREVWG